MDVGRQTSPHHPMPAWAIWVRVEQHGWTEFRYLRMLAVAGIALCFGYAAYKTVRGKTYTTTVMPAVFALLTFFAAFGPWGALNVSQNSQIAHLQEELENPDQHESTSAEFRGEYRVRTTDAHKRTRYLMDHFGGRSLRPLLGPDAPTPQTDAEAFEALGLPENPSPSPNVATNFRYDGPLGLPAAGRLHRVNTWQGKSEDTYGLETDGLTIEATSPDGATHRFSLEERLGKMRGSASSSSSGGQLSEALATVSATNSGENPGPTLMLEQLSVRRDRGSKESWKITSVRGYLFIPDSE